MLKYVEFIFLLKLSEVCYGVQHIYKKQYDNYKKILFYLYLFRMYTLIQSKGYTKKESKRFYFGDWKIVTFMLFYVYLRKPTVFVGYRMERE